MQIRLATLDDKEGIMKLYHHLYMEKYEKKPETIETALNHPTTEVFVLEEDSKIVGTIGLTERAIPSFGLMGHIEDLVVDPSYRDKSYGQALLQYCIERAKEKNHKAIDLTSNPKRVAANSLYKKFGFQKRETNVYFLALF